MAKVITENKDKKVSILEKITNYFHSQAATAEVVAKEENPDAVVADDDEEASAETVAETDDTDDDDMDTTDDEDDDMDVNGEVVNLKDPVAVRAAIEGLQAVNAEQNELLIEASTELAKTKTEVKAEIKSKFIPKNSQRSAKISVTDDGNRDFLQPTGNVAKAAAKAAVESSKKK